MTHARGGRSLPFEIVSSQWLTCWAIAASAAPTSCWKSLPSRYAALVPPAAAMRSRLFNALASAPTGAGLAARASIHAAEPCRVWRTAPARIASRVVRTPAAIRRGARLVLRAFAAAAREIQRPRRRARPPRLLAAVQAGAVPVQRSHRPPLLFGPPSTNHIDGRLRQKYSLGALVRADFGVSRRRA